MKKNLLTILSFCLAFTVDSGDCWGMKTDTDSPDSVKTTKSVSCYSSSPDLKEKENNDCLAEMSEDEDFSIDNAFWAVNGAKMDLKEALICEDNSVLVKSAINTLISIKELGYQDVLGYQYCLGVLCINFGNKLTDSIKSSLFEEINVDLRQKGKQLLLLAKKEGDFDAENYLQFFEIEK